MLYCIRIKEDPAVSWAEMIHLCPIFAGKKFTGGIQHYVGKSV